MLLRTTIRTYSSAFFVCLLSACGGGGLYNFSRTYEPIDAEESHFEAADAQGTFENVKRDPTAFKNKEVGWFGVVTSYADASDGKQRLGLSLRNHQARHLCADTSDSTCRVTVSEKSLGQFTIEVALKPNELEGQDRVWMGSLLKVYGTPTGEYDDEGGVVLDVKYYRHFPRGTYVTTAQRDMMRR